MTNEAAKEKLITVMNENNINYNEKKLNDVLEYAEGIYKDELRYTGQSYFEHSLRSCN